MMEELNILRMASAMARHASVRHRVIAENVANADTPGYLARDVKGFRDYFKTEMNARATRPEHFGGRGILASISDPTVIIDKTVQNTGNGNSVSLEAEMLKATETQGQHRLAMSIYRKTHDLLRLGLGRVR